MRIRLGFVVALVAVGVHCRSLPHTEPEPEDTRETVSPFIPRTRAVAVGPYVTAGFPVEVLRETAHFRFNRDGTTVETRRVDFRVVRLRGLDAWTRMSASYRPWFEAKPELSATVTTPDGEIFSLDPSTISEAPVEDEDGLISDARRVVAPLPALVAGAHISQTVIKRTTRPFFGPGTMGRFYFGMTVPVRATTLVLDYPQDVHFKHIARGLPMTPQIAEAEGRRIVTFEIGPLGPHISPPVFMPSDEPRYPYVAFSTIPDWKIISNQYHVLVEKQLAGFDARELVRGIDHRASKNKRVAEVLARLHRSVRYTGVELGQRSIVPWQPAVTLSRRFGDCKDKGTLLIGMLRAVGLDGHLTLVRSGFEEDVRPDLPGLEPFNHAIVRVAGEPALWIDATSPYSPLGELPMSVQGRWALEAKPGVERLHRLPESPSTTNRYLEHRVVTLSDWGPVDVIERTLAFGSMERRLRAQFADSSSPQIREALEKYVRSNYKAEALASHQLSNPKDLGVPFEIEVQAARAQVGFTSSKEATIRLTNAILFSWLPDVIRRAALADGAEEPIRERRAARRALARRRTDFWWPEPYLAEMSFVLRPPNGYVLDRLPETQRIELGPGYFEARYTARDDGSVDAAFTFDVNKRRYTAREVRTMIEGLRRLWKEQIPTVRFVHEGARLLAEGKLKEGISRYRSLAAGDTGSALHQARLAEALLEVKLGAAARDAAAQAVALEPDAAYAHYIQAWVLQHDAFGRPFRPGFDREGAVAAYERVLTLEHDNPQARKNLAELLEYDQLGRRYEDAEGVEAAISNYRRLRKSPGADDELDQRLLMALFRAGRCAELSVLVRDTTQSLVRDGLEVTCAIVLRGVPEGMRVLSRMGLPAAARQAVIESAVRFLVMSRAYGRAREVALMAIPGAADPVSLESQVRTLSRLKPMAEARLSPRDPARVVQRLYEAIFDGRGRITEPERFFSQASLKAPHGDALKASLQRELAVLSRIQNGEMPYGILRDSIISLTRFETEGDERLGYRITTRIEGGTDAQTAWFVVKERGGYKIRGASGSAWLLGIEALARVRARRFDEAAQWLDWGREVWTSAGQLEAGAVMPFLSAWPVLDGRPERLDPARIRAAAVLLAALGPGDADILRALGRMRGKKTGLRGELDHATFLQFDELDDDAGRLRSAARIRARAPNSNAAHLFWTRALIEAGRYREAKAVIAERQVRQPDVRLATEQLADVAVRQKDFPEAQRLLRKLIQGGSATARTYNNLAWLRLFSGAVNDDDLGLALRANSLSAFKDASQLHTLAALYAETGRPQEALQLLIKRLDVLGRYEPENVDWYLIGRVQEHFGLTDMARRAYEKVELEPHERGPDSTHALAQLRLRQLSKRARTAREVRPKGAR